MQQIPITGNGCFLEARVCRPKKKLQVSFSTHNTHNKPLTQPLANYPTYNALTIQHHTLTHSQHKPLTNTPQGESLATAVSEAIPFLEYDLHRQLVYKLKVQGMNALFGLRFQLTVGDSLIVALATGTAVCVENLGRCVGVTV